MPAQDDGELVALLTRRNAARASKDYPTADALRDELKNTFSIDLNDRANTWTDARGRVGTQDGPDFFENRGERMKSERAERKKKKDQEKAARREDEKRANAFTERDIGPETDAPRDPNAFVEWLRAEEGPVKQSKSYKKYPDLGERCIDVIAQWRLRFEKNVWLRLLGGGSRGGAQQRLIKELLESLHVIARVMQHVERHLSPEIHPEPITILDLCSGFGYLSMFLAELLPAPRIDKIVLLDKGWPMHSQSQPSSGQINPEHLFLEGWPIRMTTSKNNLKTPAGRRCIDKHIFESAPGAVIVLGIHLCGQLSVRAVEIFNTQPKATMLALKPCCLPQIWAGMPQVVWTFSNGESVDLQTVGINGRFIKNVWRGPPRSTLVQRFGCWGDGLFAGIACPLCPATATPAGGGGMSGAPAQAGQETGEEERARQEALVGEVTAGRDREGRQRAVRLEGVGVVASVANGWKESEECDLWDFGGDHYQNRFLWGFKAVGSCVLPAGGGEGGREGAGSCPDAEAL